MSFQQLELFHPYNIAFKKAHQALFEFNLEMAKVYLTEAERCLKNSDTKDYFVAVDFFQKNFKSIQETDNLSEWINRYLELWSEFETSPSRNDTLKTELKKHYFRYLVGKLEKCGYNKIIAMVDIRDIYSIYWQAGCYRELYQILLSLLEKKPDDAQLVLMAANTSHTLGYRPNSWVHYGKYCLLNDTLIDKSQILDRDWKDLLLESKEEELSPAWVWIKAQLKGIFPLFPENYGNHIFLPWDIERLREEYQRNPSDDTIASQLWFKTLQEAENGENVVEHRMSLEKINPAMFAIYMEKKKGVKIF